MPSLASGLRGLLTLSALLLFIGRACVEPPSSAREPIAPLAGTLVLSGGGSSPASTRFLELAQARKAPIVVLTVDTGEMAIPAQLMVETCKSKGVESVQLLGIWRHEQAEDEARLKGLTDTTAVWVEAGDTGRLLEVARDTLLARRLRRLLEHGSVVGGNAEATAALGSLVSSGAAGLELLPGFSIEPYLLERDRLNRLLTTLARHPGHAGLGIDSGAAVVLHGRSVTLLGKSYATACLSAGGQRPASVRVLRAGTPADLVALSRAALARAGTPFPPARLRTPTVEKGTLVIGGGGKLGPAVWKRFIELAGGPDARIVVVPTANPDPLPPEPIEARMLRRAGAKNVVLLHTRSRAEANSGRFLAPLRQARGVWFTGGRQWRFVDSYEGTATEKAFHEVLQRGGVIGGSSAGASIQSEYMPRGDPLGNLNIIAEGYECGFGFLPGAAVDQHFFARHRQRDMSELMATYPQLLGIGIDEGTVALVHGSRLEVMGASKVAIYDRRKPVAPGGKDYEELKPGDRYDLAGRKRLPPAASEQ